MLSQLHASVRSLDEHGYCTLPGILAHDQIRHATSQLDQLLTRDCDGILRSRGQAYGIRNLLQLWPAVVDLLDHAELKSFVAHACRSSRDQQIGIVRALLFDKPPGRSWTLPWHRDRTIAVRQIPPFLEAFSNPTRKAGIPHLVAPNATLSQMLTLRFSLDPMCDDNGPLVVIPGSHQCSGGDDDLANIRSPSIVTIHCNAGDVFAMRPLLAHSSLMSRESTELRRRVVHLELAPAGLLPSNIDWYEFRPIT